MKQTCSLPPRKKRVGEIELFRFIFSVIILLRHFESVVNENLVFPGGAYGVEFFFLVSGYLMMASVEKASSRENTCSIPVDTWSYLRKKVKSVYLEIFLAYGIGFVVICVCRSFRWNDIRNLFRNSIFELLLVQRFGLGSNSVNSPIWYIESMLLAMAVLYPLNRKYQNSMKYIIMPMTALFLLGYLQQEYRTLRGPSIWLTFTYKGNIRAVAELCIGAECFYIVQNLKQIRFTRLSKWLLTLLKWVCWGSLILYMWQESKYDFYMLLLLCISCILAFSQQCADAHIYQNKLVTWLGKFSLYLYLSHYPYRFIASVLPKGMRYRYILIYYVSCSFATALFIMFLSNWLRNHFRWERFSGFFVKKEA